jgi:RimJ/RimL family protein N-acetyltransferase
VIDIVGKRVRLRSLTMADIEPLVAAREADDTSFGPPGQEARARVREQIARGSTLEDGDYLALAVEADGRLVGDVQARMPPRAWPPGVCEIGISLFPDARGQGYGREAVMLFTEYLFSEGLERVQASTPVGNTAMRRVLELVGYGFEGVLRSYGPARDGGREDYAMYAASREDWPSD